MPNQFKENSLSQTEKIINNLSVVVYKCLVDLDWTMIYMSDSMEKVTGYKADDFIGFDSKMTYSSIIYKEDRDHVAKIIAKAMLASSGFQVRYRIIDIKGKMISVFEKGKFVKDKQTLIEGIIFPAELSEEVR